MTDSLQHVGVLGMRWGHRKSGSSGGHASEDHTKAAGLMKKKVHQLSNEEIKFAATRLSLVKQYKDLNPSKVKRGAKHVDSVLTNLGKAAAAVAAVTTLAKIGVKIYKAIPKTAQPIDYLI
jgi:hypothetical protein